MGNLKGFEAFFLCEQILFHVTYGLPLEVLYSGRRMERDDSNEDNAKYAGAVYWLGARRVIL